ncbi:SEC-C domain-containing protein [Amycolatopsis suaedae]|uniref:SEC-C domain-containing protein n=1 Tax=Amycolatopsis suaedae TaxID=2510978 RepID=A0A4Q7JAX5_9PSEU|nr:SEC-C domain-containing protein [Amycolatopsis suaedae]RZQ64112.1 hypothetical protein EWH70_08935 [Amycolatopsis suaedae]
MRVVQANPNADMAEELEAELALHPEQRGQILVEAAGAWHRAGNQERSAELLTQAIALGGEDGGCARVAMAEFLFALDREAEARTQLAELRQSRLPSPIPHHLAAELLSQRGEYQEALTWFNTAVSRLTEQDMAELTADFGFASLANAILTGRGDVRQALRMPADELDESVLPLPDQTEELFSRLPHDPPAELQVLFWPRDQIPLAHAHWPQLVERTDVDLICADREADNRELSEAGVSRIVMVPLTAAALQDFCARTGRDPLDGDTRMACMNELADGGNTISWPPTRNAPCWCGSASKYKKCCGRPL